MGDLEQEIVKYVINTLNERGIPASKIVLQKLIFFLRETGIPLSYSFEPYLYGPYSRELADDLDELAFWDKIIWYEGDYSPVENYVPQLDEGIAEYIRCGITKFSDIVDRDYEFDSMEIFGTVFYCIKSLNEIGEATDLDSVLDEFGEWKGDKYEDDIIEDMYTAIMEHI